MPDRKILWLQRQLRISNVCAVRNNVDFLRLICQSLFISKKNRRTTFVFAQDGSNEKQISFCTRISIRKVYSHFRTYRHWLSDNFPCHQGIHTVVHRVAAICSLANNIDWHWQASVKCLGYCHIVSKRAGTTAKQRECCENYKCLFVQKNCVECDGKKSMLVNHLKIYTFAC